MCARCADGKATTFMPQFEACVESGGLGMMCSFNSIRGVPACANHRSMVTWARGQWNFPGYIVSDQGAAYGIYSSHKYAANYSEGAAYAVKGGLDLEDTDTPADSIFALGLPAAVADGLLAESDIDQSVSRLMYVRMKTGEFDNATGQRYRQIPFSEIRSAAHLALTKQVAAESFVLLENKNRALPLQEAPGKYRVAVVGPFADCQGCYYGKYSPHRDVNLTTTVAAGLQAAGSTVHVASGCSQKPKAAERGSAGTDGVNPMYRGGGGGGPGGCGCASCPCPAGAGPEPYMCTAYNKTAVVAAVAASDVCVIAVGLGANVESEGRWKCAPRLGPPHLHSPPLHCRGYRSLHTPSEDAAPCSAPPVPSVDHVLRCWSHGMLRCACG